MADQPIVSSELKLAEMKLSPAIQAVIFRPAMKKSSPVPANFFK